MLRKNLIISAEPLGDYKTNVVKQGPAKTITLWRKTMQEIRVGTKTQARNS